MKKFFRFILKAFSAILRIVLAIILICLAMNGAICISSHDRVLSDVSGLDGVTNDCIVVLGCAVYSDGTLSDMLRERLDKAVELYFAGAAPKILVTGDHSGEYYNEVNPMKEYAVSKGVPAKDVYVDHYGVNTYDSIWRAANTFGLEKIVIVSQKYHLYRSVYCAEYLGMNAYGVAADTKVFPHQFNREVRELISRTKIFVNRFLKPEAKYYGDSINMDESGNNTNSKWEIVPAE